VLVVKREKRINNTKSTFPFAPPPIFITSSLLPLPSLLHLLCFRPFFFSPFFLLTVKLYNARLLLLLLLHLSPYFQKATALLQLLLLLLLPFLILLFLLLLATQAHTREPFLFIYLLSSSPSHINS